MCEYFRKHGQYCRRKHLYSRLEAAKEKEDKEAACQILAIIQREKNSNSGGECPLPWGSQKGEHVFGCRWSRETGQQQSIQAKRNYLRLFGITSIRGDSTLPSRPLYANNHSKGPSAIMPSVKLHRRF
jgi:hypothetical protein